MITLADQHTTSIGMGAWDIDHWNAIFYPPQQNKGFRKLQFYSQFFDSVEINATFYNNAFTPRHARRWLTDVAENKRFIFTVKLYRGFTHTFDATVQDVKAVHRLLEPMEAEEKCGGLLLQFPYSFTNIRERRLYLMQLSKVLQPHRLFVEVRHNSWNSPLMYNFFQENKLHLVNVDLPLIKQHMPLTAVAWDGYAYFRMMGCNTETWYNQERGDRYDYLYSDRELEHLLRLLQQVKSSAHTTFVVFHNDPEAKSLFNGFRLRHLLRDKQRVLIPKNLIAAFPELKQIGLPVNVLHPLFAGVEDPLGMSS